MTTRSTTVTLDGRSWTVELLIGTSRHECPRVEVEPTDDPSERQTYAYKLGDRWQTVGYTEHSIAHAFDAAVKQLESSN